MNELRRRLTLGMLTATLAPGSARGVVTDYPKRPVRLIVPYAPGGGPDVLTRRLATRLGELLGQNVVVENKVGAGGIIAAEVAAQAAPDGYTLMLGASTHVTQKLIQPTVKFDPLRSFTHITRNSFSPAVLIVRADSPWRNIEELVAAGQKEPGLLNYASGGIGSAAHLSAAAFTNAAQIDAVHVPYRGSVEIVPSLMSGATHFAFPVVSTALPHLQSGKVRALALTCAERLARLPEVPTLRKHFSRADLVLDAWSGVWAPAGLPDPIVRKLFDAIRQAQDDAGVRAFYESVGTTPSASKSPAEFTRFIEAETAKYASIVKLSHIALQ